MTLILPIGIPASGKTTISEDFKKQGYTVINPDSIRQEMFGDYLVNNEDLWREVEKRLSACLIDPNGKCVIDATNIKSRDREPHIRKAKEMGHQVRAVFMQTHPRVAEELNKQRDRKVPRDVIYRMYYQTEFPRREEGFDGIEVRTFNIDNDMCRKIGGRVRGEHCVVCEYIRMTGGRKEIC